jgi:DNA helicase-2/ATP-dependent DNA helicase PcrA
MMDRAARADVYNSPGWKRMQDRATTRPVSQPREARNVVIDIDAVSAFDDGDRVFHKKFGYGTVTALEGDKLCVAFDKAGEKHVLAGFLLPADLAADLSDDIPF